MEDAKFNNLCSHYKDSFDNHKASIKQRDMLFYLLLVILSIFTLQLSSTESVTNIVNEYVKKIQELLFLGAKNLYPPCFGFYSWASALDTFKSL